MMVARKQDRMAREKDLIVEREEQREGRKEARSFQQQHFQNMLL